MFQKATNGALIAACMAMSLAATAGAANLNKSITIADGAQSGSQSTVNGSISVGTAAIVDGSLETVNGTIRIAENARVGDAETVNGSIRVAGGVSAADVASVNGSISIGENATVAGEVSVVNGRITLGMGTTVARDVSNVNGEISLEGADVGGTLSTVNGDVSLSDGAILRGDLVVEKPRSWGFDLDRRKPKIIIGPNSQVLGDIRLEREVELYISESATVGSVSGEMSLTDAVRFSGTRP